MCGSSAVTRALLVALLVARGVALTEGLLLHCRHERCRDLGHKKYKVDGNQMSISYNNDRLTVDCDKANILESPAMPRAEPALRVPLVLLMNCPLPAAGSLVDSLAALNVTLEGSEPNAPGEPRGYLQLYDMPAAPPLAAKHFAGLERLVSLDISGDYYTPPRPELGFLAPLQSLRSLEIRDVVPPAGEMNTLTFSLRELDIFNSCQLKSVSSVCCDSLHKLCVRITDVNVPTDWLANCSLLETLIISWPNSDIKLPPKLLLGASALTLLALWGGRFETLPAGLLDYSPNLLTLQLERKGIQTLPSDMFAVARRVRELNLSNNKLDSRVMDALAPLEDLTELDLGNNPSLGDVCKTDGYSAIRNLTKLSTLQLSSTSVSRICRDWREDMTLLATLDLTSTNVSQSLIEDLQFTRTVEASVFLSGAWLSAMNITREDYNNPARRLTSNVSLHFEGTLECDCRVYWTRRALALPELTFIHTDKLRCSDGQRLLRDVPPEDMVCARPEECSAAALPDACECAARPDDDSSHDRLLVRVRCEHTALPRVPRPRASNDSTERVYELLLAHNNITDIHADDVQGNVKVLDLRHNALERVDEEAARRLADISGMLRLAGNPLECSCRNVPLLRALRDRNATRYLSDATCSDGSMYAVFAMSCLQGASTAESPAASPAGSLVTWIAVGLAVLLALALVAVVYLASPERRFFARAVLHRWGFEWRAAEPEDDGRRYDAFITFSHKDQAVVHELMAHLEPDYRLCIHERDWTPGCYIAEQIVESVRESRRTVALVSRHFLASSWARAEFREAHTAAMLDARPRLVVVLLEEPAALEMDEQLRRYVATQTYMSWGEKWFWHKLAVALPRKRAPPPDSAPPPPAQPALELVPVRPTDASASPSTVPASL